MIIKQKVETVCRFDEETRKALVEIGFGDDNEDGYHHTIEVGMYDVSLRATENGYYFNCYLFRVKTQKDFERQMEATRSFLIKAEKVLREHGNKPQGEE